MRLHFLHGGRTGGGAIPHSDVSEVNLATVTTRSSQPLRRKAIALLLVLIACESAAAPFARAQAPQPQAQAAPIAGGFQAYTLRNVRADDVRPQLQALLSGGAERFEIVVEAASNRLFVAGSQQTQTLVAQALTNLDRAVAPPAPPAAPVAPLPTMRAYQLPGIEPEVLAEELRRRYSGGVTRIAADSRTAQVLVVADDVTQRQIAAFVAAQLPAPAAAAPQQPVAAQSIAASTNPAPIPVQPYLPGEATAAQPNEVQPPASQALAVTLRAIEWPTLEAQLRRLYGVRLSSTTTEGDGRVRLRLALAEAQPLDLAFDPATRTIELTGDARRAAAAAKLITAFDRPAGDAPQHVVPYRPTVQESLRQALTVSHRIAAQPEAQTPVASSRRTLPDSMPLMAQVFQPRNNAQQPAAAQPGAGQTPAGAVAPPIPAAAAQQPAAIAAQPATPPRNAATIAADVQAALGENSGLVGPVQIEFLDGLDVLVVSGNDRDVERVLKIIEDIERLSVDTKPTIEIVPLEHVSGEALAGVVTQIYDAVLSTRQGKVSITALVKPNALLLIGRPESVQAVSELVKKLDQPVEPTSQFAVYPLKHANAATVQTTLQNVFLTRPGLGATVQVTADARSNSLIVRGSPRDLIEAGELIKRLDVVSGEAENELRVFHLENALADELAPVLEESITAQLGGAPGQQPGQQQGGQQQQLQQGLGGALNAFGQQQNAGGAAGRTQTQRSTSLRFTTIDSQGHKQYRSGIMTEVRITADARANSLLVSAPAEAMELIAALIRQLDATPAARAQIKVFTIVNGDATRLVEMLNALFGIAQTAGGGGGFGAQAQQQQGNANLLVRLRFSVDQRTNSIIASGSADDLTVVEAILLRLDDSDIRQRQSIVYRLKNAPATDVANAINQFLRSERDVQQVSPGLLSPFEQIEREVVVVPEPVSNSLIVSSTPRYFEEIRKVVEEIDKRPPMVMIQVLIAEVALNNTDEFGIELGLQDSILFDRSLLGDLVTITNSTQQAVPGGGTITTQNQNVVAATNTPGYAFNNAPLGNSGSNNSLSNSGRVGAQGLSSFAVGRTNADLGFGGLVLSASSESVSVLIRALQESRRLDVLSRPQVMTLDNQAAFVQVGSRVPRVQGVTVNVTGQVNNVVDVNVGLILGVTPRISPDGLVVMEIDAEKSALGPEAEGVPISVSTTGDVVRQPVINTTTAQTTVSAMNGQTVVLGGLITKSKSQVHRRVPVLSSIPILGNLFRYDNISSERTELLIIMTPHVVRTEQDAAKIRQIESARMSWCLGDVKAIYGNNGLQNRSDLWLDDETMVIYPDESPHGTPVQPPLVPTPPGELPPPAANPPGVDTAPPSTIDAKPIIVPSQSPPSQSTSPPASSGTSVEPAPESQDVSALLTGPYGHSTKITWPSAPHYQSAPPQPPPYQPPPNAVVPVQYVAPLDDPRRP